MPETNRDLRRAVKDAGLKLWQVANGIGINDGNFSRKLRKELSDAEKQKIYNVIAKFKEGV